MAKKTKKGKKSQGPKKFAYLDEAREKLEAEKKEEASKAKQEAIQKVEVELPTKAAATDRTDALRAGVESFKEQWWTIGAMVRQCLDDRVPEAMEMSATAWLEDVFGGEWQRFRRAAVSCKALLPAVSLDTIKQISEGNAYTLASLPQELQADPKWVKKAATMKNADFEEAVLAKRKEMGDVLDKEVGIWTVLKLGRMEESFKNVVSAAFETAKQHLETQGLEIDLNSTAGRKAALETIFGTFLGSFAQPEPIDMQAT